MPSRAADPGRTEDFMQTMYFRNTLSGGMNATYLPCQKPVKPNDFIVEVVNIPDDVDANTVKILLNKTVIWKASVIEFSSLGEGKLVNGSWGGSRPGAGRPSTGRRKRTLYITDEEYRQITDHLETLRKE